jgi:hypothetical protein
VIESAEKDILAHRDLFSDVKENRGAVTSSPTLKVETAAALLSTANVYQSCNRSNSPGLAHPGFSTDTRGNLGFFQFPFNRPKGPYSQQPATAAAASENGRNKKIRGRSRRQEDLTSMRLCPTPPPGSYPYWMCDGEELHLNECARYARTAENLIEIPAEGGEGSYYFNVDPPFPTGIPNVHDIGPRSAYTSLIAQNINTVKAEDTPWAKYIEQTTGKKFDSKTSPLGTLYGRQPRRYIQKVIDDASVFLNKNVVFEPDRTEYVGYAINGRMHHPSRDGGRFMPPRPLVEPSNRIMLDAHSRISSPGLPGSSISQFGAIGSESRLEKSPRRSSSAGFPAQ